MNARKAHNTGRNHVSNVRDYFASLGHDKAQNIIDAIIQSHEGGGGRQQMMAAPSMRLGAGFMNPVGASPGLSCSHWQLTHRFTTVPTARRLPSRRSTSLCSTLPTQYAGRPTSGYAAVPAAGYELDAAFPAPTKATTAYGWHAASNTRRTGHGHERRIAVTAADVHAGTGSAGRRSRAGDTSGPDEDDGEWIVLVGVRDGDQVTEFAARSVG